MSAERPIITVYVCPPIPVRYWDWQAFRDGNEESGPVGWGRTKEAATAALIKKEEDERLDALETPEERREIGMRG